MLLAAAQWGIFQIAEPEVANAADARTPGKAAAVAANPQEPQGNVTRAAGTSTNLRDDPAVEAFYTDHRAWQHGMNLLKVGSRYLLVWSSWGNPPRPVINPEGNWEHDVFYSWLDPSNPQLNPQTLVTDEEAQEPASAAISSSGRILMSCEDGKGDINQHAGLWDSSLTPIVQYPFTIRDGGHSGHVAAMGDRFLVVYSEGWIDGGGVDGLGTGDDVWARIVDGDGNMGDEIPVSVSKDDDKRDWWPMVAASDHNWLEVWQRYPSDTLHGVIIGADGTVQSRFQITDNIDYYHYSATYLPSLGLYAVTGTRLDGGFISLITPDGTVISTQTGLPAAVRESKLITQARGGGVIGVYPTEPNGAAIVRISYGGVDLVRTAPDLYPWDYMGTDGMFVGRHRVLFATLSKHGVRFVPVAVP